MGKSITNIWRRKGRHPGRQNKEACGLRVGTSRPQEITHIKEVCEK